MPKLDQHVVLPDMNSVATATIELPRRIMTGSLSGDDLTALVISCFFEAMLVGAVLMAHKGSAGRRLLMAARRAKGLKDSDLTAVLAAGRDLPPDLAYVASEIERYRIAVWPFQFVIVVHGCADPGLRRIAEVMPSFCALDIAMRHPFIPEIMIHHWVNRRAHGETSDRRGLWALIRNRSSPALPRRRPWPSDMRDAARYELVPARHGGARRV